jgi:hypothetical protein
MSKLAPNVYVRTKVEQWAARKGEELTIVVLGDPDNHVLPTHQDNDEALWNNLLMALRTAYSEYHGTEGVTAKTMTS